MSMEEDKKQLWLLMPFYDSKNEGGMNYSYYGTKKELESYIDSECMFDKKFFRYINLEEFYTYKTTLKRIVEKTFK